MASVAEVAVLVDAVRRLRSDVVSERGLINELQQVLAAARSTPSAPISGASEVVREAQQEQSNSSDYFGLETLLASVDSGAIAPLRGSWLVTHHKAGGRLKRRQDLPIEAFWTARELRSCAQALGRNFGVLFVALSYRWLTKGHPDPDGFHLTIVAQVAALYLNRSGKAEYPSQLTQAFEPLGTPDFALFWDFASLHQSPRLQGEEDLFRQGLSLSNVWYGNAQTVVWLQSELPAGFAGADYDTSGWCFVEAAISAAIKPGFQRLDLAKRTTLTLEWAYGPEQPGNPDVKLACVCARSRLPPPSPERVEELLRTQKKFTNASDVSTVAKLYATFFASVVQVDALDFKGLAWGPDDAAQLCQVLPRFHVTTLE